MTSRQQIHSFRIEIPQTAVEDLQAASAPAVSPPRCRATPLPTGVEVSLPTT
ncbi:hypothetical protein [Amycolatopsis plumensis]|uniref:hypothetical protein n=1 Tax=Amycolatopsis plumensis TaxID=236508 RepID=UPI003606F061